MSLAQQRPYLTYLNFVETVISWICQVSAFFLMSHLIYCGFYRKCRLKVNGFSNTMLVYMFTHAIFCFLCSICIFDTMKEWRPLATAPYDAYRIYFQGVIPMGYATVSAIPIFFLTLNRCLALKWGAYYEKKTGWIFFIISIGLIILFFCISLIITLVELPLQMDLVAECTFFSCMLVKYKTRPQLFIKLTFGFLNLVTGCYFFYLLRSESKLHVVRKTRVVKITLFLEIGFNIIPTYVSFFFNLITGESAANILGQYVAMFSCADAACSGIILSFIFLRRKTSQVVCSSTPPIMISTVTKH
uniref:Uncharacterized protein n=1 Tax=Ditylenchus dipsaci TaxID=166011 RepID=A0A915D265_9BILA